MNKNTLSIVLWILVASLLLLLKIYAGKESFGTSPGTMVQLQTSHVPTQADADYFNFVLPKQVRKDITNMTGEDPGELHPMQPPLGTTYVLMG